MDEQSDAERDAQENPRLSGEAEPAFLADEKKRCGEIRVGDGTMRDGFGESPEERVSTECHDEWREAQGGDQDGVEATGQGTEGEREACGDGDGEAAVVPEFAEEDRAQAEQRADGEVDTGGDDDGGEGEGEEADFARMAEDVELPVERAEADDHAAAVGRGAGEIEEQPFGDEHVEEQHLVSREQGFPVAAGLSGGRSRHGGRLIGAHHCTHRFVALILVDFWFHNMSADERRLAV